MNMDITKEKKRVLKLDRYEHGIVFDSLNCKRNELLKNNESTALVDEVLIKVADAPYKNERKDIESER